MTEFSTLGAAKPWGPIAVGILNIVAGPLNLFTGLVIAALGGMVGLLGGVVGAPSGAIAAIPGVVIILLAIVTIIGGVFALRRRLWVLALIGSILAVLVGWFWLLPTILGILAIIFTAMSKKDFA